MKEIIKRTLYEGQWLTVEQVEYLNPKGVAVKWERVVRRNTGVGMVVVAQMKPSNRLILIRQYRAAVNGYVLGFPAGLANDDITQAAQELKEETGYVGTLVEASPVLKAGSGIINDSGRIVYMHVDESLPENQNPQQELEDAEEIDVVLVHPRDARTLIHEENDKGIHVTSSLWYMYGLPENLKNG